ncbi:unnamed protein product [Linum trigynum]|uniref:Uncharacterized protein n=1 Tax=Linum trigynum TaxID=586398 RepID=A0AAV2FP42_9ROSI
MDPRSCPIREGCDRSEIGAASSIAGNDLRDPRSWSKRRQNRRGGWQNQDSSRAFVQFSSLVRSQRINPRSRPSRRHCTKTRRHPREKVMPWRERTISEIACCLALEMSHEERKEVTLKATSGGGSWRRRSMSSAASAS